VTRARVVAACAMGSMLAIACGRRAELFGEEENGVRVRDAGVERVPFDGEAPPQLPDGGVPVLVEAGLDLDAGDGCAARPVTCPVNVDFPCQRHAWFGRLVDGCRAQAGCVGGWLSIRLSGPGCASELGMTAPNAAFVECLVGELNAGGCPCSPDVTNIYLGPDCR